jgi:hypothetical protein
LIDSARWLFWHTRQATGGNDLNAQAMKANTLYFKNGERRKNWLYQIEDKNKLTKRLQKKEGLEINLLIFVLVFCPFIC